MISWERKNPPCKPSELRRLVASVGRDLPLDYSRLLQKQNGGRLAPNRLTVPGVSSIWLCDVLTAADCLSVRGVLQGRMSANAWPIVRDGSGNYVVMRHEGKEWSIAFWDHETEIETRVAGSVTELFDEAQPFDPASVQVDPDDVISVWIDPDFLKELKGKT